MSTQPPSDVIAAAQASARKWGIPASVSLAQWALESAWGKKVTGKFNYGGIKCRSADQPGTLCPTHEVVQGKLVAVWARFRDFSSVEDYFDCHATLIATAPVYKPVMAMAAQADAFAHALTGRYATDPHYGESLIAIMRGSNLYQYDVAHTPDPTAFAAAATNQALG